MFLSGSIAGRKSVPFGNRVQTRRLIVIPFHAKIQGSKDIKNYTQHLVDQAGGAVHASFLFGLVAAALFLAMTSVSFWVFRKLEVKYARGVRGYSYGK